MDSPASMIWRVALRSVLPGRIENSTVGAASSIGDRANQSNQPQKPSAAAEASKNNTLSRNSITSGKKRPIGLLDYTRIINAYANPPNTVHEPAPSPCGTCGKRGRRSPRGPVGKRPCPARPFGRSPIQRRGRGNLLAGTAQLRCGGGRFAIERVRRLLLSQRQDAREFRTLARGDRILHGPVA